MQHIIFDVDHTSSMSSMFYNVQEAIKIIANAEYSANVKIHHVSFTENERDCFVASSPFEYTNKQLVGYINTQVFGKGKKNGSWEEANGGDGPENVLASLVAVADMCKLAPHDQFLCILITDSVPHMASTSGSLEKIAEQMWLCDKGYDYDAYMVWKKILDSTPNLVVIPTLCSNVGNEHHFYYQIAQESGGIVVGVSPTESKAPQAMANGFANLIRRYVDQHEDVDGSFCMHVPKEPIVCLTRDNKSIGCISTTALSKEATTAALIGLVETSINKFSGKRALKRCRGVDVDAVIWQMRWFVLNLVAKFAPSERVSALVDTQVKNGLQKNVAMLQKLVDDFDQFFAGETGTSRANVVDIVTLQNALEAIVDVDPEIQTQDDVINWMKHITDILHCRMAKLSFKKDANGNDDFVDAFCTRIKQVSPACLSVSSALALQTGDDAVWHFVDPMTRQDYNSVLIMADEDVGSRCAFFLLTRLPELYGVLQSYLISGTLKIFPHLGRGVIASAVWNLMMENECTEYKLATAKLLRISGDLIPHQKSLRLNPEDSLAKLFANIDLSAATNETWIRLSQEYYGAVFGLQQRLDEKEGKAPKDRFNLIADAYDTPKMWRHNDKTIDLDNVKYGDDEPTSDLPHISTLVQYGIVSVRATSLLDCSQKIIKMPTILKCAEKMHKLALTFAQNDLDFDFDSTLAMVSALVCKQRTSFYRMEENEWAYYWSRQKIDQGIVAAMRDKYGHKQDEWKLDRERKAMKIVLQNILDSKTHQEFCAALNSKVEMHLLEPFKFERKHVLDILTIVAKREDAHWDEAMLEYLVIGPWTCEPPRVLKKALPIIMINLRQVDASPSVVANICNLIGSMGCTNPMGNRHGHSINVQACGTFGWTQEYENARLAIKKLTMKSDHAIVRTLRNLKIARQFWDEYSGNRQDVEFISLEEALILAKGNE